MKNFQELCDKLNNDDFCSMSMLDLRNMYGKQRLGRRVSDEINCQLNAIGIAHYPNVLPNRQDEIVRVYKIGGIYDKMLTGFLTPSLENDVSIRKYMTNTCRKSKRN